MILNVLQEYGDERTKHYMDTDVLCKYREFAYHTHNKNEDVCVVKQVTEQSRGNRLYNRLSNKHEEC